MLRVKGVRWFSLQSHHWRSVVFLSRSFGVLSCQQCFSNCDQNCFFWLVGCFGGFLFVCSGFFVFEGGVFLFVLETSLLKKSRLCFLAACVKSQNRIRKLLVGFYLLEIINQQPLKRTELLIATAFSAALIFASWRGRYCTRYYARCCACLAVWSALWAYLEAGWK